MVRQVGSPTQFHGHLALFACVLAMLCGCDPTPTTTLPPIPEISVETLPPAVQAQINQAHDLAVAQPDSAEHAGRLGMLFQAYGYSGPARDLYERAAGLDTADYRWRFYLAYAESLLGNKEAAANAFRQALASNPQHPGSLLRLADLELESRRIEAARELYRRALDTGQVDAAALHGLGKLAQLTGDELAAKGFFSEALQRAPDLAPAHYALAQILRNEGQEQEAAEHLAKFEQSAGGQDLRYDPLLAAVGQLNLTAQPHLQRATRLAAAGNPEAAIVELEKAVAADPDSAAAHTTLIGMYGHVNRLAEAERSFANAARLAPDNPRIYFNLASAYQRAGDHRQAVDYYRRALALDPDFAAAHLQLGVSLNILREMPAATASFKSAYALDPGNPRYQQLMGMQLLEAGEEFHLAKELFTGLVQSSSRQNPDYLILLARTQHALGETAAAEQSLDAALELARATNNRSLVKLIATTRETFGSSQPGNEGSAADGG